MATTTKKSPFLLGPGAYLVLVLSSILGIEFSIFVVFAAGGKIGQYIPLAYSLSILPMYVIMSPFALLLTIISGRYRGSPVVFVAICAIFYIMLDWLLFISRYEMASADIQGLLLPVFVLAVVMSSVITYTIWRLINDPRGGQ